mgnify:CR=1 FL=1
MYGGVRTESYISIVVQVDNEHAVEIAKRFYKMYNIRSLGILMMGPSYEVEMNSGDGERQIMTFSIRKYPVAMHGSDVVGMDALLPEIIDYLEETRWRRGTEYRIDSTVKVHTSGMYDFEVGDRIVAPHIFTDRTKFLAYDRDGTLNAFLDRPHPNRKTEKWEGDKEDIDVSEKNTNGPVLFWDHKVYSAAIIRSEYAEFAYEDRW